jgi:hypothetical protein
MLFQAKVWNMVRVIVEEYVCHLVETEVWNMGLCDVASVRRTPEVKKHKVKSVCSYEHCDIEDGLCIYSSKRKNFWVKE